LAVLVGKTFGLFYPGLWVIGKTWVKGKTIRPIRNVKHVSTFTLCFMFFKTFFLSSYCFWRPLLSSSTRVLMDASNDHMK